MAFFLYPVFGTFALVGVSSCSVFLGRVYVFLRLPSVSLIYSPYFSSPPLDWFDVRSFGISTDRQPLGSNGDRGPKLEGITGAQR